MNTIDFQTKTEYIPIQNPSVPGIWPCGIDIGYSGTKSFSPNSVACFPSFAKPCAGRLLAGVEAAPNDILYKDETGKLWYVGELAQSALTAGDTNDTANQLYGRIRYDEMFTVISRVGLANAMRTNCYGGPRNDDKLVLQTGLPPAFIREDASYLRESLAGRHKFSVKFGTEDWRDYDFTLQGENIKIMAQPMGALMSASMKPDATYAQDARDYLSSNILVWDGGFGTLDGYPIRSRAVIEKEAVSFTDLGMKRVLEETADLISRKYNTTIPVHAMQPYLKSGMIPVRDRRAFRSVDKPFADLLDEAVHNVCQEAITRMTQSFDFFDYRYLLVAGGTGAAWLDIIKDCFAEMHTMRIITGNQNDTRFPDFYSISRGYYMYLVGSLRKAERR